MWRLKLRKQTSALRILACLSYVKPHEVHSSPGVRRVVVRAQIRLAGERASLVRASSCSPICDRQIGIAKVVVRIQTDQCFENRDRGLILAVEHVIARPDEIALA